MPDFIARNRRRDNQKIPRIERKDAERIFAQLEHLLECNDLIGSLRTAGFAQFLKKLEDAMLQLAVQPDSWGERTRARLVSEIIPVLRGVPAEGASVDEIVHVSNILMPCFLLELGRRKKHIEIEFPQDPCNPRSRFQLGVGPPHATHTITNEQLSQLVTKAGEELVGLCYFGDPQSREKIDAELNRGNATANSKTRPCRASSSTSPRTKS